MNLNNITIGNYIDIQYYIKQEDIFSVYKCLTNQDVNEVSYVEFEKTIKEYISYRDELMTKYPILFQMDNDEYDIEKIYETIGLSKDDLEEDMEKVEKQDEFVMWYDILYRHFANEQFLNMKKCYDIKLIEVFNHLAYLHTKK